jgi:hypothetical protein
MLFKKPNLLFLIAIRHPILYYKLIQISPKLQRDVYRQKMLRALTIVETNGDVPAHILRETKVIPIPYTVYKVNGKIHREDGPAITDLHGSEYWFYNNQFHKDQIIDDVHWNNHNYAYSKLKLNPWYNPGKHHIHDKYRRQQRWYICGKLNRYLTENFIELPTIVKHSGEQYHVNGLLHRSDGPAYTKWDKMEWWTNGELHRVDYKGNVIGPTVINHGDLLWHVNSELHRTDGPAVLLSDGTMRWFIDGKKHRIDGPAVVKYGDNGNLTEKWYYEGERYRMDNFLPNTKLGIHMPCLVETNLDGRIVREEWCVNGVLHREDGPAYINRMQYVNDYGDETIIMEEIWYIDGQIHRDDGPAVIVRRGDDIIEEDWYINGEHQCGDMEYCGEDGCPICDI